MAGALGFLSGLVRGVADTAKENRDRMEREEFKKVQIKLFKHDLEQKEQVDLAKQQVFKLFQGFQTPTQTDDLGLGQAQTTGQAKRKSLMDILADPEGQMALMQSGMMKPADILQSQQPGMAEVLKQFTGGGADGGSGAGGMELSGIKIGPNGQIMPDLSRPKFKTEVPGPGGRMIQLDEYGRQMGTREGGLKLTETPEYIRAKKTTEESVATAFDKEKARPKAFLALTNAKQR